MDPDDDCDDGGGGGGGDDDDNDDNDDDNDYKMSSLYALQKESHRSSQSEAVMIHKEA
jgi:hypothetical protein